MTIKDEILETLNCLPEVMLPDVLEYLRRLQSQETIESDDDSWQAYLESEQERQNVYRQLADA